MKLATAIAVITTIVFVACTTEPVQPPTTETRPQSPTATAAANEPPTAEPAPTEPTTPTVKPTIPAPAATPQAESPPTATTAPPTPTATPSPTSTPQPLDTPTPRPATPSPTPFPIPAPIPTRVETSSTATLTITVAAAPTNLPDYDRNDWEHWIDADGDCQDARNEVLVAESQAAVSYRTDRRCRVSSGQWLAPYSNTVVTDPGKLDIDHMVPLRNAHLSGAWEWSAQQKEHYANYLADPQHLIAVTASANRSKGARGPEDWKPDERSYWCQYAIDWTTIKENWDLTVTPREHDALIQMLNTCANPPNLRVEQGSSPTDPRPTSTPDQPNPTPATRTYSSCDAAQAAGEARTQGSKGSGRGFPKSMVPSARDGDADGIVCER